VASLNLVPFPQHETPIHKHLLYDLIIGCEGEYFRANYALAPFSPIPTSFNTTPSLIALHHESNGYFPLFLKDYEPDQNLELFF
jgi:hypothetical protein